MTLRDVQSVLLNLFYEDTILIGHSLESDLRSLKVSLFNALIIYVIERVTGSSPQYREYTVGSLLCACWCCIFK